jgi:hypothetical protein
MLEIYCLSSLKLFHQNIKWKITNLPQNQKTTTRKLIFKEFQTCKKICYLQLKNKLILAL